MAVAAFLPWVTVEGLPLSLDLLGTDITAVQKTVSGVDTPAWPVLLGVGGLVLLLALTNVARKVQLLLGLLVTAGGAGLLYYLANVIDIETADSSRLERLLADAAVGSSVGAGPVVLLGGGIAILLGALAKAR